MGQMKKKKQNGNRVNRFSIHLPQRGSLKGGSLGEFLASHSRLLVASLVVKWLFVPQKSSLFCQLILENTSPSLSLLVKTNKKRL